MSREYGCATRVALVALWTLAGCALTVDEPEGEGDIESQGYAEVSYSPGAGWSLVWSDEFGGDRLNTANWNVLTSNYDPVTNNCNFGTGELEYPRAANVAVRGGKLILSAQRTSDRPAAPECAGYGPRSFYSGRIHTKGKVERRYGKIAASIKVPSGYGMWPAFWTLGANINSSTNAWPRSGEIDILEWKSTEPTWMKSAVHWYSGGQADWGTGASRGTNLADAFHVYEVEWTASSLVFRLDGSTVANDTFYHNEAELQQPHYLLLNLAIGGNWYGNPSASSIDLPAGATKTMEVEWVRWYQRDGSSSPSVSITNPSFEAGMSGWTNWSPNGTQAAGFSETYGGAKAGSYHLTHWTNGSPFEVWTYQTITGIPSGTYKLRAWAKKGGSFDFSRLQAKTCPSCGPYYRTIGTAASWTQVETDAIPITGGYLEIGLHTRATRGDAASFTHLDAIELVRL